MTKITAPAGCNVYVASLPLDFTDQQLGELFAPFGAIASARVMRSKGTRQSKGYGFVMFKDAHAAEMAVANLHGASMGTASIQVRIAHQSASRAVRNSQSGKQSPESHNARETSTSEFSCSHTEDSTGSATPSDGTSTSLPSQVFPQQPQPMLYPVPQTLMPMVASPVPTMYPAFAVPQATIRQDTLTMLPSISQPLQQPMYLVILPDGRQAVMCAY